MGRQVDELDECRIIYEGSFGFGGFTQHPVEGLYNIGGVYDATDGLDGNHRG